MPFSVEQEHYSGPLALLLELIDERKLEITQVSLAQVADAFLEHIQQVNVPEEEMTEFLVVAARLIYLKSKELLPYFQPSDEEEEVAKLEDRLRAYKEFVDAAKRLSQLWGMQVMYARAVPRIPAQCAFSPGKRVTQATLHEAFQGVIKRVAPFFALREQRIVRTASLEERMHALRDALAVRAKVLFRDVAGGVSETAHVVVNFLALLEMLRREEVRTAQQVSFGDILVEKK